MRRERALRECVPWLAVFVLFCAAAAPLLHRGWMTLGTDFPNYYVLAHLRAEGSTVDRAYEWLWLQRQKDHLNLAQPLVGLGQITPFSAAVLWPVARLSALTAKHVWMLVNGAFLVAAILLLWRMTRIPARDLCLLCACCVPLWRNFEYGQFYLLLLLLVLLALWFEQRGSPWLAGFLIGLACALKVFPLLLLLVPLARGKLRVIAGAIPGLLFAAAVSVRLFGLELCRRYISEVLPRGLRGDIADPYSLGSGSMGAALRRLFVFDPGLNPDPLLNAPMLASLLGMLIALLLLGLVWLVATKSEKDEVAWALAIMASLLVSSAPASYQFTLLLFPVCVLLQCSRARRRVQSTAALLYLAAVAPWPPALTQHAWFCWLQPRWFTTCSLFALLFWLTRKERPRALWRMKWKTGAAVGLLLAVCAPGIVVARRKVDTHLRFIGMPGALFEGKPQWAGGGLNGVRLQANRYVAFPGEDEDLDELSVAAAGQQRWVEKTEHDPTLLGSMGERIEGESPALSPTGKKLVFLRESEGQGRLYSSEADGSSIRLRTGPDLDVYEAAVDDRGVIYLAAQEIGGGGPQIYLLSPDTEKLHVLVRTRSRDPAVSPDGRWLAFSEDVRGSWQLRLLDLRNGGVRSLTNYSCNVTEPAWKGGSDTQEAILLVSSDCGRGLGLTGAFEIRVP